MGVILKETVIWKRTDPTQTARKGGIFSLQTRQNVQPDHAEMVMRVGRAVITETMAHQLVPTDTHGWTGTPTFPPPPVFTEFGSEYY